VPAGVQNGPDTSTQGFEVEYAYKSSRGSLTASYSSHKIDNTVKDWAVPGHEGYAMGLAREKGVVTGEWILNNLSVGGGAIMLGPRYGYAWDGHALALKAYERDVLMNVFLTYRIGAWELTLDGHDLLDRKADFPVAYAGGSAPFPSSGREFGGKVKVSF